MPRKKDRFYARVDGHLRELFSISEGADGSLAIMPRGTDNLFRHIPNLREQNKVYEHHFSVHRTLKSEHGINISQTLITATGEEEEASCFIKDGKYKLLWPVFSVINPDLRHERYNPSKGKTSCQIVIAGDIPKTSTFIYHVFVSSLDRSVIEIINCETYAFDFKYFRILIYACYVNLPSSHVGIVAGIPTSKPTVDGVPLEGKFDHEKVFPGGSMSLTDEDVFPVIHMINQRMFWSVNDVLMRQFPNFKDRLATLKPFFSRHPQRRGEPIVVVVDNPTPWTPPIQE